jgi:hypothetical protein
MKPKCKLYYVKWFFFSFDSFLAHDLVTSFQVFILVGLDLFIYYFCLLDSTFVSYCVFIKVGNMSYYEEIMRGKCLNSNQGF